jgi:hypothetical protein
MPYRQQQQAPVAREVLFDDLLPETQAALARVTSDADAGCLLLEHRESFPRPAQGVLMACLLGSGAVVVLGAGYSDLSLEGIVQRDTQQAALGALVGLCSLVGALCWRAQRRAAGRPLRPGLYLLGHELVDARSRRLRLFSTEGLTSVTRAGDGVALSFRDGSRFLFGLLPPGAEQLEHQITEARSEAGLAEERGDRSALLRLDPLALERPRWAQKSWRSPWWRRLAWLGAALVSAATAAALACAAGRIHAIEGAIQAGDEGALIWFSVTDRWLSSWADWRLRASVLRSSSEDAMVLYSQLGLHREALLVQVTPRLNDCAEERASGCVQVLRGICAGGRRQHTEIFRKGMNHLDSRALSHVLPHCRSFLRIYGLSEDQFRGPQIALATEQRDVRSLWDFGAREVRDGFYEEEIARLSSGTAPAARAMVHLLARLKPTNDELTLRVETGGVFYASVEEERAFQRWRHEFTERLRKELLRHPSGKLLRLKVEPPGMSVGAVLGPLLVVDLGLATPAAWRDVEIREISWRISGLKAPAEPLASPFPYFPMPPELSEPFFVIPLSTKPRIVHPLRGLPTAQDLRFFGDLLLPQRRRGRAHRRGRG